MTSLPLLTMAEWEPSRNTLHLFMQIIGKVRLALHPKLNHWWHVTLYVSDHGLTTASMPYLDKRLSLELDLVEHQLVIRCSDGPVLRHSLPGLSVAAFYRALFDSLSQIGVEVRIKAEPYDLPFSTIAFGQDEEHKDYDPGMVQRYWEMLKFVARVFEQHRGHFLGKSTPVHLFWHHADLALTRFSGKQSPLADAKTQADREAYSHEVISCGFWTGDELLPEPAFYTYLYPEPKGLGDRPLLPESAAWRSDYGYTMAYMPFEALRHVEDPATELLTYLQAAYMACADAAAWPENLNTHVLTQPRRSS